MILLTFNVIALNDGHEEKATSFETTVGEILKVLKYHNTFATFFVGTNHAVLLKPLLKKIIADGHEVALYNETTSLKELSDIKKNIEEYLKKTIRGLREFQSVFKACELKELEFNYVSEIENADILFPFKRLIRKTEIRSVNGISVIPESISPYSQIPYNDFTFQTLPGIWYRNMVDETVRNNEFVLLYLNSWQFDDTVRKKVPFYRQYNLGSDLVLKLDRFLAWVSAQEIPSGRIKDYLL